MLNCKMGTVKNSIRNGIFKSRLRRIKNITRAADAFFRILMNNTFRNEVKGMTDSAAEKSNALLLSESHRLKIRYAHTVSRRLKNTNKTKTKANPINAVMYKYGGRRFL